MTTTMTGDAISGGVMTRDEFAAEMGAVPAPPGRALTATDVEARLIEAFEMLDRIGGDVGPAGNSSGVSSLWRTVLREWSEYSPDTYRNRVGANYTTADVARMEESLGWCEWLGPMHRRLIAVVVPMKAIGRAPQWKAIGRRIGWAITGNSVRMRYQRALNLITVKANAARTG